MHSFIRRYEVWVALGAIIAVNAVFVAGIATQHLPRGFYNYGRFALLAFALFGVILLTRGVPGIVDALRPLTQWRRNPLWYVFALSWGALACVMVLLVKGAADGQGTATLGMGFSVVSRPSVIVSIFVGSLIGEIVWVSYALRRLTQWFTTFVSALIVGAVWTAWWLPMVFYNVGVVPDLPPVALLINQTGIAVMCVFLYAHTRSGFLVLCMQCMFNMAILVFPVTPVAGGVATYWTFAVSYFCAALALFLVFGPRPLLRRRRAGDDAAPSRAV